jgi:hypothetical protein
MGSSEEDQPHKPAGQPALGGRVARAPRGRYLVVPRTVADEILTRRRAGEGSADIGHDLDLDPLQILDVAAGRATITDP